MHSSSNDFRVSKVKPKTMQYLANRPQIDKLNLKYFAVCICHIAGASLGRLKINEHSCQASTKFSNDIQHVT